ncbi:DUF4149 domain-containing protein [Humisphaera borealis]|uniref:DUF4149 domain-containing protein n=1 Tax=Humisphaera borealis TaxID=2807512 RepID=A0A7M2WQ20_9BACT|nr:DUF4149 domain-containing protein [Humisphaera borealis]QOV87354.1 DUF4149 domain-containing protein [Humisphaera borealis]
MNRLFSIVVTLTWGIWTGGLMGVTLSVIALARTFPPRTDGNFALAAPPIFAMFERVQLGLAAAALIFTFAWRLRPGAKGVKSLLFALFALGTVGAVVEATYVAPRINELRVERASREAEFNQAHQLSERLYGGTFVVLVIAGLVLPVAIANDGRKKEAA